MGNIKIALRSCSGVLEISQFPVATRSDKYAVRAERAVADAILMEKGQASA
jgi:hypothetical protein